MVFFFALIAVFIAWIWVDYFRLIDVYEPESLKYFIITFLLGAGSVYVTLGFQYYIFPLFNFPLNGEILNDFLYIILKIGAVEELSKFVPFVIVYYLFRRQINEPIDYVAYICVSALGFSAVENVMYFSRYGGEVINARAILASVGHMADTALIAYGIILYKYKTKKYGAWIIVLFFVFAALSHGLYDFWLIFEDSKDWGIIVTIVYFFMLISVFATILNNALNNSSFFSYKKGINSGFVSKRLLTYYGIIILLQGICVYIAYDITTALWDLKITIFTSGAIILVTCIRLSRFKHIKGYWEKVRLELPFSISAPSTSRGSIAIKGNAYDEVEINKYFNDYFLIKPLDDYSRIIKYKSLAYLEKLIFNEFENTWCLIKVFENDSSSDYKHILIKPKSYGTIYKGDYPIVSINLIKDIDVLENFKSNSGNLKFVEWAYIKPLDENFRNKMVLNN